MPSAQYHPIDTGNGRPVQNSILRGPHNKKATNSRRMFVCIILLMMLLVYVVWCTVANFTDEDKADSLMTTGKFQVQYHKTSPRSQSWNLLSIAAPLLLEKLMAEHIKNSQLYFNSSIIFSSGLGTSTLLPPSLTPHSGSAGDDMQRLPNIFDNKLTSELSSILCTESFMDPRLYIQDKPRQEWDHLSTIYFVTPTYPRREQVPELTRLAYTLLHVPRLHWIVANDYSACNPYLNTLLHKFGIPFTHLSSPMPERFRNAKSKPRGVANRRAAIQWLRQRNITTGVLYFGDDDNTYDLKLFGEIRDTKLVSMFPVGLIANYGISGPVVRKGKVVGFLDSWVAGRRWPVDMAGFAVSLSYMSEYPNASMPFKPGYEEDYFLRSIALTLDKIEPKGNNCTEILVWHTQTKSHNREPVKISHGYLDNRSNLGALFKALAEMGVSNASDDEGHKAIISSNGKAKSLSYYLS